MDSIKKKLWKSQRGGKGRIITRSDKYFPPKYADFPSPCLLPLGVRGRRPRCSWKKGVFFDFF
jgi:hypothetical protein